MEDQEKASNNLKWLKSTSVLSWMSELSVFIINPNSKMLFTDSFNSGTKYSWNVKIAACIASIWKPYSVTFVCIEGRFKIN